MSVADLEIREDHKIKGSAVKNLKRFLDSRIGTGYFEDVMRREGLIRSQAAILVSAWYSARSLIKIELDAATHLGLQPLDFFREYGKFTIQEDLNGIYRSFLRLGGAERVLSAVPRLSTTYMNYMDIAILANQKGLNRSEISIPMSLSDYSLWTVEGAAEGILNVCKQKMTSIQTIKSDTFEKRGEKWVATVMEITY